MSAQAVSVKSNASYILQRLGEKELVNLVS